MPVPSRSRDPRDRPDHRRLQRHRPRDRARAGRPRRAASCWSPAAGSRWRRPPRRPAPPGLPRCSCCPADVTDEDAVRTAVDAAVARFGRLDVVVHAAQVMAYGTIEELPREVYETVVDVAVHGTANVARVVLPVFRRRARATSSSSTRCSGSIAAPLMGSYVTAKWGQLGLVRVLQQETRDEPGISISAVQPGGVDTPIYFQAASWTGSTGRPPPPVYSPQRVARAVLVDVGPAAPRRPGGAVQPADHRRVPAAAGRVRLPGRAAAAAHGDRERRGAADRGQRLRVPARRQRDRGALAQHLQLLSGYA